MRRRRWSRCASWTQSSSAADEAKATAAKHGPLFLGEGEMTSVASAQYSKGDGKRDCVSRGLIGKSV